MRRVCPLEEKTIQKMLSFSEPIIGKTNGKFTLLFFQKGNQAVQHRPQGLRRSSQFTRYKIIKSHSSPQRKVNHQNRCENVQLVQDGIKSPSPTREREHIQTSKTRVRVIKNQQIQLSIIQSKNLKRLQFTSLYMTIKTAESCKLV